VWSARSAASGLRVAVKVVPGLSGDRAPAFLTEVRAVATLQHPNVVRVFDLGVVDDAFVDASRGAFPRGAPFLVMEWVGGGTLAPPTRWDELHETLRVLLRALAHAHARGVLHRDLKPANVLLGAPGDLRPGPKLVDFGLARLPDTGAVGVSGTPAYMAPEQIVGAAEGAWTDLYALGAMTWELITGGVPFGADTVQQLVHARLVGTIPAFEPRFDVPSGLAGWLGRLLARWPEHRWAFAADALRALETLGPCVPSARPALAARPTRRDALAETLTESDTTAVSLAPRDVSVLPPADPEPIEPAVPVDIPVGWVPDVADERAWLPGTGLRLFRLRQGALTGRMAERERLWAALRSSAAARRPRAVVLRGPAGMGKSRLASWLVEEVQELGVAVPAWTRHGRPPARDDGVADLLARVLRLPDEPAERAEVVERHPEADALERALDETGGLPGRFAAAARVLRSLAGARPLVIWLDDPLWSGTALTFALALLRDGDVGAVLVVLTVQEEALADRPVQRAQLERLLARPDVETIPVGPLPDGELEVLLDGLLELEPVTARFVRAHAAGNPLLALRLVDVWIARGVLVETPRGFGVPALPELQHLAPEDVLAEELEAVLGDWPPADAVALERAAVLGDAVRFSEWAASCARDGLGGVPGALVERLLDRGVLVRTSGGVAFVQGMFRVALLHRAARAGRDRAHHAAAAESLAGAQAAARIGEHWLAAGRPDRAIGPLLSEARLRRGVSEIGTVGVLLRSLRSALDAAAVPRSDSRWGEYLQLELWLQATATGPSAGLVAAEALRGWAVAHGSTELETEARCRAAWLRGHVGDDGGLPELRAAWALAFEQGSFPLQRIVGDFLTAELRNRGLFAEAITVATQLLAAAERADNAMVMGNAWRHLGVLARMQDRDDEALAAFSRARALLSPDSWELAETVNNIGDLHRFAGRLEEAAEAYVEAARRFRTMGSYDANVPGINLALTRVEEGRLDDADALLQRCIVSLVQTDQRRMEGIARTARLPALARRGDRAGFALELARGREGIGDAYVDPDVARVLVHGANETRAAGWVPETHALVTWAERQLRALGRTAEADRLAASERD
jgi:serine/threonine protein kinase/tetratricopeptide (TPR) repeat protein